MAHKQKKKRKPKAKPAPNPNKIQVQIPSQFEVTIQTGNGFRMSSLPQKLPAKMPMDVAARLQSLSADDLNQFKTEIAQKRDAAIRELLIEYSQRLPDFGYGQTKDGIMSLDQVDITEAMQHLSVDTIACDIFNDNLMTNDMLYSAIPCFTEGCVKFAPECWIHWQIREIDTQAKTMAFYLMVYFDEDGVWSPGVSGQIFIQCNTETREYSFSTKDVMLYHEIYSKINLNALGWDEEQKSLWKNTVRQCARQIKAAMSQTDNSPFLELARRFMHSMMVLNYYLELNQPIPQKRPRRAKTVTHVSAPANEKRTEKIMRMVGLIPILSRKPPRLPTEETVIHYRLSAWKTRGHVRHYKSGKTVYIQDTIRHRKALRDVPASDMPSQVIYLKDNIPEEGKL